MVGLRPGRRPEIRVGLRDDAGSETWAADSLEFTTAALPEVGVEFPPIQVTVSRPAGMEPGLTLFNPRRRRVGRGQEVANFNAGFGMLAVLDHAGEVVWHYRTDSRISGFEKLADGDLAYVIAGSRLVGIDWLGNAVNQRYASRRPRGPGRRHLGRRADFPARNRRDAERQHLGSQQ